MTNALINSALPVTGIKDPEECKRLVKRVIYPVSQGLTGKDIADRLSFPANRLPFALCRFRLDRRIQRLRARLRKEGPRSFSGCWRSRPTTTTACRAGYPTSRTPNGPVGGDGRPR